MITDNRTNTLFLSAKLGELKEYDEFLVGFLQILKKHSIDPGWIEGSKDIWARDYMPVQRDKNSFIQFQYNPSYLEDDKYDAKRTLIDNIKYPIDETFISSSDLNLDGGNVIRGKGIAIISERVFNTSENSASDWNRQSIKEELHDNLKVSDIVFVPPYPNDYTGHADGLIRLYNESTVLVSESTSKQGTSSSYAHKLYGLLGYSGFNILQIPSFATNLKVENDYTALGCYANYLQVGKVIFLPKFYKQNAEYGHHYDQNSTKISEEFIMQMDERAFNRFKELFPGKDGYIIEQVPSYDIAIHGGVLNCITWNILI